MQAWCEVGDSAACNEIIAKTMHSLLPACAFHSVELAHKMAVMCLQGLKRPCCLAWGVQSASRWVRAC